MKKFTTLLVLILSANYSSAARPSGLNTDLLLIYILLIGICVSIIGVRNGYKWLRNGKHKQNQQGIL